MPFEYKPRSRYDRPVDPDRCKAAVHERGRGVNSYQCQRKSKKDGWCLQHHPDTVAERQRKADERYKKQRANSPIARLRRGLEEVKAQRDALLEALKATVTELEYYCEMFDRDVNADNAEDALEQAKAAIAKHTDAEREAE